MNDHQDTTTARLISGRRSERMNDCQGKTAGGSVYAVQAPKGSFSSAFSLSGRATRANWWCTYIAVFVCIFGIGAGIGAAMASMGFENVEEALRSLMHMSGWLIALTILFNLLTWPVCVRRFHDLNHTGWFIVFFWLIGFIPLVGWISWLIEVILLGFVDGTMGPNNYGNDPRGRQGLFSRQDVVVNLSNRNDVGQRMIGNSVEQRLTQLKKLKDQGMISDAEYEEKRSKILSDI